jgi:hypothetical protein
VPEVYYNDTWLFDVNYCPGDCNGRGVCQFGYCFCDSTFYGADCQEEMCPGDTCAYNNATRLQECRHCSGNGACYLGVCRCDPGFDGARCEASICLNGCYASIGHGICVKNANGAPVCECTPPYVGVDCSSVACLNDCSGHGECFQGAGDLFGQCVCTKSSLGSWTGDDCSTFAKSAGAPPVAPSVVVNVMTAVAALVALTQLSTLS